LKLTGGDLLKLGLIDGVIPEPMGGAHQDQAAAVANLRAALLSQLDAITAQPIDALLEARYQKFRGFGEFSDKNS
jgi:acetyl-CoA carboxylase carboxyl transferase subunit alpha